MTLDEITKFIEQIDLLNKTSDFSSSKLLALKIIENKILKENPFSYAKVLHSLGVAQMHLFEYAHAIETFLIAIEINTDINNIEGLANNHTNLGSIYKNLDDYNKALEMYEISFKLNEQIGRTIGLANVYGNIAGLFLQQGDYIKALEYYQKSYEFSKKEQYDYGIAMSLGNIGAIYFMQNEYNTALQYFEENLVINQKLNNKHSIAVSLGRIATIMTVNLEYEKAKEIYSQAIQLNIEIQNKKYLIENYYDLGNLYFQLRNYELAEKNLLTSIEISNEVKHFYQSNYSYKLLSSVYESQNKFELSLECYKKHVEIQSHINSDETKKKTQLFDQRRKIEEDEKARLLKLARFQEQEKILHNILPINIANRIINQETFIADHFQSVSVLFMDLVGFTSLATIAPPKQLVYLLDAIFQKADEVVETFGLEKIKTIGDGYLAVANVTTPLEHHQKATALAALQLLETMQDFTVNIPADLGDMDWIKDMKDIEIRIGIHTGEVVAGIIGKNKYTYDLWGDAVNVASRMESNSEAGRIHISKEFAKSIEQHSEFLLIPRGKITIKGKGTMNTYWLEKVH